VTPCNVMVEWQCFGGPCCFHLQGELTGDGKRTYIHMLVWNARGQQIQ